MADELGRRGDDAVAALLPGVAQLALAGAASPAIIQKKLTRCDTNCTVAPMHDRVRALPLVALVLLLALAGAASARPVGDRQRRAAEHPRRHDRRRGRDRRRRDAQRPAAARRPGHDVRRRRRLLPALLPGAGDVHHRPVRPQPRRRRQLLALRLVRHEGPRQHAAALAAEVRLHDGADRQVAERLRRQGRPRRGAEGVRDLARPARRLRLRLLQLRHEHRRQAEDLGRLGLRAQARPVRQGRGHPPARAGCRRSSPSSRRSSARRPTRTGARRTRRTTRPT